MINQFHNRLAGTIIIVSLGVLFLPDLFDGQKESYQEEYAVIPLTPSVESGKVEIEIQAPKQVTVELPEPKMVTVGESTVETHTENVVSTKEKKSTQKIDQKQEAKEPEAWVIQVGFFRSRKNAEALVEKIRAKGYTSHVYPRQAQKDVLNRVIVGPDLVKENLSKIKPNLEKLTGLKIQVIKFDPLDV